jgi:protein-disulfide isomerase
MPIRALLALFPALLTVSLAAPLAHAADDSPVASIDGQSVPAQELGSRTSSRLSQLERMRDKSLRQVNLTYERERSDVIEKELNALLDDRVLSLEATAKKSTPEGLKSAVKVPEVTDAQIRNFYDANKGQLDQPLEKVSAAIKDFLQKQAKDTAQKTYIAALRAKHKVKVNLEPLRETVEAVGPQRGPDNAPITMVVFSDFECPFCGRFSPVIKDTMAKYPNQIRLVYRHLPLTSLHPNAQHAAEAAVCAQNQGKFWEMHDLMFAEQSRLGDEELKEKAKRLGLDSKSFDECLTGGQARDVVRKDVEAAEQLGIGGTPFSFINGRFINGAALAVDLGVMVDDELRRIGAQTAAPAARR